MQNESRSENENEIIKKFVGTKDLETLEWMRDTTKDYTTIMTYYRCALMEIETKLNVLNEEFSLKYDRNPINGIKSRLKSPKSILEKMQRRNIPFTFNSMEEKIYDIAGVRVICSFVDDVYTIANALLSQDDVSLIEMKDYIKNPKENGYRSLHIIVAIPIFLAKEKRIMKVEIQLRTIAMDFWASLEHQLHYKKDYEFTKALSKELKDCADISAELDIKMDNLRSVILES